jgi:hypothetical protein
MTGETHQTAERRRDLDLLRVLIVFGLVFFHTARIFDTLPLPEGVKNEPPSVTATIFVAFFSLWGIPLMFTISGFAVWHSLRRRTARPFCVNERKGLSSPLSLGCWPLSHCKFTSTSSRSIQLSARRTGSSSRDSSMCVHVPTW